MCSNCFGKTRDKREMSPHLKNKPSRGQENVETYNYNSKCSVHPSIYSFIHLTHVVRSVFCVAWLRHREHSDQEADVALTSSGDSLFCTNAGMIREREQWNDRERHRGRFRRQNPEEKPPTSHRVGRNCLSGVCFCCWVKYSKADTKLMWTTIKKKTHKKMVIYVCFEYGSINCSLPGDSPRTLWTLLWHAFSPNSPRSCVGSSRLGHVCLRCLPLVTHRTGVAHAASRLIRWAPTCGLFGPFFCF